jgi:hypothetical protein
VAARPAGVHFEWLQPSSSSGGDSPAATCTALYIWRDGRALLQLQPLASSPQHICTSTLAKSSSNAPALEAGSRTSSPAPPPAATAAAISAKANAAATAAKREAAGKAAAGAKEGHAAAAAPAASAAVPQEQHWACAAVPGARSWVLPHAVTSSAISSEAGLLATGHSDGSVLVWDARMGACLCELAKCPAPVASLGFVPAGGCKGSGQQQEVALLVADAAGSLALHRQAAGAVAGVLERAWQVPAWGCTSASAISTPCGRGIGLLLGSVLRVVCTAAPGLALLLLESRQGQPGLLWLDVLQLRPLARLALPPQSGAAASTGRPLEPGAVAVVAGRVLLAGQGGTSSTTRSGSSAAVLLDFGPVDAMVERVLAEAPTCSQPVGGQPQDQQLEQQCKNGAGAAGSHSGLRTAAKQQSEAAAMTKLLPASGASKSSPTASPANSSSQGMSAPPAAAYAAGQLISSDSSSPAAAHTSAAEDPVARALAKLQGTWGAAPDEAQQQRQLKHTAATVASKLEAAQAGSAAAKPMLASLLATTRPRKQAGS